MSDNEQCKFFDAKSGETVALGVRETGLFRMLFRTKDAESMSTAFKCESIRVWQQRLAHQNIAYVKRFLQQRSIQYTDEQFQCEPCILGKHHRLSFGERKGKETELCARLYTQMCADRSKSSRMVVHCIFCC